MRKKILLVFSVILILTFVTAFSANGYSTGDGESGTTLTATITASATWTGEFTWELTKGVVPASWNLFTGDSGTSEYTLVATKSTQTIDEAYISGEICVTNGGAVATENLAISVDLKDGLPPPDDIVDTFSVDVSAHPVLIPGESYCYPYRYDFNEGGNPAPHAGGEYKPTAHVTITNHSGSLGTPFGPDPSASITFPANPTLVHDSADLVDSNGFSWHLTDSATEKYSHTFTCDTDEGSHKNTAYIDFGDKDDVGPSASATVTVACDALEVTKTAETAFHRDFDWSIEKVADQTDISLEVGETRDVNYSVLVDATSTDSDWSVSGEIKVHNPATIPAIIKSLTDIVSPDIVANLFCYDQEFPYTLAAGQDLFCDYIKGLPDGATRTNTATATLQNFDYDKDLIATPSGTTDFTGTKQVVFSDTTGSMTDRCVTVKDSLQGVLGTLCADVDVLPKTYTYTYTVGPYDTCGDYTVDNTATVYIPGDKEGDIILDEASWTVSINLPCGGCTLTQGYWKTHSKYGPAPYDDAWELVLPDGEDTTFHLSGQTWYEVLWTEPRQGNVYYILAHQYIAAVLNKLNGADTTVIDDLLADAKDFFTIHTPDDTFTKQEKAAALEIASQLDEYNNGLLGPGHCDFETDTKGVMPAWVYSLYRGDPVIFIPTIVH